MKYYTIKRAAEIKGVPTNTMTNWVHREKIASIKHGNRRLISADVLAEFKSPAEQRGLEAGVGSGWNTVVPPEDWPRIAEEYANTTVTLQTLADTYGVTREAIRAMLVRKYPEAIKQHKRSRSREKTYEYMTSQQRMDRTLELMQEALDNDRHCAVCGGWVIRAARYHRDTTSSYPKSWTCSEECAEAWPHLRTFDYPDAHRIHVARAILRHPDKRRESEITWAHQMLSDNPPPPNRRYVVRGGSVRAEMIKKWRPEEWAKVAPHCPRCQSKYADHVEEKDGRTTCTKCDTSWR